MFYLQKQIIIMEFKIMTLYQLRQLYYYKKLATYYHINNQYQLLFELLLLNTTNLIENGSAFNSNKYDDHILANLKEIRTVCKRLKIRFSNKDLKKQHYQLLKQLKKENMTSRLTLKNHTHSKIL